MTEKMFDKLIDTLDSPDWLSLLIQFLAIIAPILFAVVVSIYNSKKTKNEVDEQNKILDERQSRLEDLQSGISENIKLLTSQQEKIEQNLREITRLANYSNEANLLTLQGQYSTFFGLYNIFKTNFYKLYGAGMNEEKIKEIGSYILNSDSINDLSEISKVLIPPLILDEYNQLINELYLIRTSYLIMEANLGNMENTELSERLQSLNEIIHSLKIHIDKIETILYAKKPTSL